MPWLAGAMLVASHAPASPQGLFVEPASCLQGGVQIIVAGTDPKETSLCESKRPANAPVANHRVDGHLQRQRDLERQRILSDELQRETARLVRMSASPDQNTQDVERTRENVAALRRELGRDMSKSRN